MTLARAGWRRHAPGVSVDAYLPPDLALAAELRARASAEGFAKLGFARAEALGEEAVHLREFLAAGRHGSMDWLARTEQVRADPRHEGMVPEARSVIVLASAYARSAEEVGPSPGRVARYARGRDYHNVLERPLRRLERWLQERGYATRHSIDSRPVFERAWAARAGVGFVGKNACLIVPGVGSHVFLSTLVTAAPLPADEPMAERCGACRACLDACPTQAFVAPRVLDARRCVSYLTIEHAGSIDEDLRAGVGPWFLGCDGCQDVCPYNRGRLPEADATSPYRTHERWQNLSAADVLSMDDAAYLAFSEGSPARRLGRERAARNAALNLGNSGDKRHLPVLREASADPSPVVREAVAWAMARLEGQ